jgi:hypothetical protein
VMCLKCTAYLIKQPASWVKRVVPVNFLELPADYSSFFF